MRILAVGTSRLMMRAASMPLMRGMRTSISTTSGASSMALATASSPFSASATTSMCSSVPSTTYRPRRNRAWSSAIRTRMTSWSLVLWSSVNVPPLAPCSGGVDQADVAIGPPVHDGRLARVGVREEEEVVPEQVHLQRGFLRRHRLDLELLRLDDPRIVIVGFGVIVQKGLIRAEAYRSVPPRM